MATTTKSQFWWCKNKVVGWTIMAQQSSRLHRLLTLLDSMLFFFFFGSWFFIHDECNAFVFVSLLLLKISIFDTLSVQYRWWAILGKSWFVPIYKIYSCSADWGYCQIASSRPQISLEKGIFLIHFFSS